MNVDNLKKKILYRSERRGTKEMDLLLSNFFVLIPTPLKIDIF